MNIYQLRKLAGREEIDYQFLTSALQNYVSPRNKISQWLRNNELIRVKKGLYVFGPNAAEQPYSKELLANLIYGPSAISLSYALSYYNLIPESVATITSITNKRNKKFSTSIGNFSYHYLNDAKYAIGITMATSSNKQFFLIARPEKALCDQIYLIDSDYPISNLEEVENYLIHNLRVDVSMLADFDLALLNQIALVYNDKKIMLFYEYLQKRYANE